MISTGLVVVLTLALIYAMAVLIMYLIKRRRENEQFTPSHPEETAEKHWLQP